MAQQSQIGKIVEAVVTAPNWNSRVDLIRTIPQQFGTASHLDVYTAIGQAYYVSQFVPDFAYVHWRDEYELEQIEAAYGKAHALTQGFKNVEAETLKRVLAAEPATLRIFRLILGFTTQEFAASSAIVAEARGGKALSNGTIKSMENGKGASESRAEIAATVIDQLMDGTLFTLPEGGVKSKLNKPDTAEGWDTVRKYASENVPLPVFLHQRHYGGAFRQILDATSSQRGNILEKVVEELLLANGILFIKTGQKAKKKKQAAGKFSFAVDPIPDFLIHDKEGKLKAILECKHANDGGTARDKAGRFSKLRAEGLRLSGVPVFAVLAGLGWRRIGDTLAPVIGDTEGRVFTIQTLEDMMTVEPFPGLKTTLPQSN